MASDSLAQDHWLEPPGLPANYEPGGCYPIYKPGFLPDNGSYIATNYSNTVVNNDAAKEWAEAICHASGVSVRHLMPPNPNGPNPGAGPSSDGCELQVVHAILVDGSLITVMLPPGWSSAAPIGYYPIIFSGFYDVNGNLYSETYGRFLARVVAQSSLDGKRGVIGVLWNGGGGTATLTMHPRAIEQFAAVIDLVSQTYRGNREWIVTFGGSRGGYTSLAMASNPHANNYRVVMAAAVAPPTRVGDLAHSNNPTFPGMFYTITQIVGFKDAWMPNWRYPSCAGRPHLTGLRAAEAALVILTGNSDREWANQQLSPASPLYLDGLHAAGTQVYLEITEHDMFISYLQQLDYAISLVDRGIPLQLRLIVRGGHVGLPGIQGQALLDAVAEAAETLSEPQLDLHAPVPNLIQQSLEYHRWNRDSQSHELFSPAPNAIPFSLELPYKAFAGDELFINVIGEPGTQYDLLFGPVGTVPNVYSGVIGNSLHEALPIPIDPTHPELTYQWSARITDPSGNLIDIPTFNTPTGAMCTTKIEPTVPVLTPYEAYTHIVGPQPLSSEGTELLTSWGLSQF